MEEERTEYLSHITMMIAVVMVMACVGWQITKFFPFCVDVVFFKYSGDDGDCGGDFMSQQKVAWL